MARRFPNHEHIYATPAQLAYIRRLIDQARSIDPVRPPIPYPIDLRRSWLKSEASRAIDHLIAEAKKRKSDHATA